VTIHRGTAGGGLVTSVGSDTLLMAYVHIAHDCEVGDHVILVNGVTLAGHVSIGDWVELSAFCGVHQFCRVGTHGYVGGYTVVTKDVLPYSKTVTERNTHAYGPNVIGLERKGFSSEQIHNIKAAFRLLLQSRLNTSQAVEEIKAKMQSPEVQILLDFIETADRGVIK